MEPVGGQRPVSPLSHALRSVPLRTIAPITTLALLFFAGWLLLESRQGLAAGSFALALLAGVAAVFAHRNRQRLLMAGVLLCLANACGSVLAAWVLGQSALPWVCLALMSNAFIVHNQIATPINLLLIAALLAIPGLLLGAQAHLQALVAITLTFGFGYHFSRRMQGDRMQLEELAWQDALTGLPNRRALEKALLRQLSGSRESRTRQALLVLDIDYFKAINDRHGHAAGDVALSDLAAILRFELRENDKVFRFGGEEFVILAETGSREALECFAERIRKAVYQALRGPDGRITVSLGAAMYAGEQRWQDWFARADAALYQAKHQGRNSIAVAP